MSWISKLMNETRHLGNQYRLELHCTIDTQPLTIEGTEQIRQTKLARRDKELEDRRAKSDLNENQLKALHREESKQRRLENAKHFRRSNRPLYKSSPDVLIGVSFTLAAPATVAVVKGSTGEVISMAEYSATLRGQLQVVKP